MANHYLDTLSADSAVGDAVLADARAFEAMRRGGTPASTDSVGSPLPSEPDQLARDIAEIERVSAVLRKVEPALQSWPNPPAPTIGKPRPVWLLVGVLWISTAIVTVGAAVAIAALVG